MYNIAMDTLNDYLSRAGGALAKPDAGCVGGDYIPLAYPTQVVTRKHFYLFNTMNMTNGTTFCETGVT
jgi:hypothetical protein